MSTTAHKVSWLLSGDTYNCSLGGNPEEGNVELMHHQQLNPGSLDLAQFDRLAHMRFAIIIYTSGFSGQKCHIV